MYIDVLSTWWRLGEKEGREERKGRKGSKGQEQEENRWNQREEKVAAMCFME